MTLALDSLYRPQDTSKTGAPPDLREGTGMTTTTPEAIEPGPAPGSERLRAAVELLKPITWFPPMWAFACGAVSAGVGWDARLGLAMGGIALAGPLLCGGSQVVNDWFDREVDAINEPDRPIPSGRAPGRFALWMAIGWSLLALAVAALFGRWVLAASTLGVALAWAYSAPPLRLKRNGWIGNSAVALSYEGLAWITGAAVVLGGALPDPRILLVALLYSIGAHGIMTLNDFKSVDGDRLMGIGSLPARLGVARAARIACVMMVAPQLVVIACVTAWSGGRAAAPIAAVVALQLACMPRLLRAPRDQAAWYNATGVTLYVTGMMVCAWALR
ncbi:MAG: chlorophyll synthase ChlG [Myxococcota bacterium]